MAPSNPRPVTLPSFPYCSQLDNGPSGYRQCQTSAIAMALKYLRVPEINDDLDYLRVVDRYGDTTRQDVHMQALHSLQVKARFRTDITCDLVTEELLKGRPVCAGILHHGSSRNPSGGGHWVTVYGQTDWAWQVMDPGGELDLVRGGFCRTGGMSGSKQLYSFRNMGPRWFVEGDGSGWAWTFQ